MNDWPIELHGIGKSYSAKRVLTGLDLSVPRGSVLGLLGTNGAGKTTLIKCALGLIRPQSGTARLLGEDSWTLSAAAKARIGYVPQVINLYPWMKVRHLIDYTAAFYPNWNHYLVARLTDQWAIPREDRIGPLSVGQLQKVAILLALGHEPELLILDEPAASLDPLARRQFLQMIIELAEPGKRTVLFSTHITSDLERVADRVAILSSGRIAWHGLLEDLKEQTHVSLEESFLEMHAQSEPSGVP
jgi:ABC-2 type transport system ATP-binding protein